MKTHLVALFLFAGITVARGMFQLTPYAPTMTIQPVSVAVYQGQSASFNAEANGYDADPANSPVRIINLSTLGFVGSGTNELTSGFVIAGSAPKQLLIRAVGPGLEALGVGGALADPQLAIVPLGRDFIATGNDNWGNWTVGDELKNAFASAQAFALPPGSKDAALVVHLPPGGYTVTVSGAGNTTGTALVEIYDLDP